MRTLNRPMFNMGGPIKQGIMHGIREPYKGGQLVRPGPGRPGYAGEEGYFQNLYKAGKQYFNPARKARRLLKLAQKIPGAASAEKFLATLPQSVRQAAQTKGIPGSATAQSFMKNLKSFSFPGSATALGWGKKALTLPLRKPKTSLGIGLGLTSDPAISAYKAIGKQIPEVIKGVTPNWIERLFTSEDEVPDKDDKDGVKSIQENITWTPSGTGSTTPIITQSMLDKVEATKAQRQKNKMLEIMGYDDSKKDAAYNALIDASQIIAAAPGGKSLDISRDIIQPAIAATSKQFDKPKDIKEAVGLLMAKGEIEKDIAAGKGGTLKQNATDLVNAGVFKTQAAAMEHLAKTESIREKAVVWAGSMKKDYIDQETVISVMHDTYGSRPNVLKSEDEMDKLKKAAGDKYVSDLDTFTTLIKQESLGPGSYVIGTSGFVINSDGKIKQVLG